MPYKGRATRLEYLRNYYRMKIKPDNELRRENKGLKPSSKTSSSPYLLKNRALDSGVPVSVNGGTSIPTSLKPATTPTPGSPKTVRGRPTHLVESYVLC
jgi:hypothetical protein